jgi:site-specific DNA-cytosine methylase
MNIFEVFSCSGGMAEGFRRAGLPISMAFDWDPDARASYTKNLGHAPIGMDARDLLRLVEHGWRPKDIIPLPVEDYLHGRPFAACDLFIADPPCTPWSRAGKRKGTEDERDMLLVTVDIVRLLRPTLALIANVPGLDDAPNWPTVQATIGSLAKDGYCIDFVRLDAADYGVPQHRIRPFWFLHPMGTDHVTWPVRTHGAPGEKNADLFHPLQPWVTCRQALGHLPPDELGAPIRLRWRGANPEHPPSKQPRASKLDDPAQTVRAAASSDLVVGPKAPEPALGSSFDGPDHRPSTWDAPAATITRNSHSDGCLIQVAQGHPPNAYDRPARVVRATSGTTPDKILSRNGKHPPAELDAPAPTLGAKDRGGQGAQVLDWPWERPSTTICSDDTIGPPGHHDESFRVRTLPNAIKLSEKAASILQGFPEHWHFAGETKKARWSRIGQAMPPPLAEAVARSIRAWMEKHS